MLRRLCVFCGSQTGNDPIYTERARELGREMARRDIELVFGAGHIGIMGVVADAVLEAGGKAIGVIPQGLVDRELAHTGLTSLRIVSSMHERKSLMAELSDAVIALPGGFGTADEFFEILTWKQLKLHDKATGLLNVAGFFDPLLAWIDHTVATGFVKEKYRDYLLVETDVNRLLDRMMPTPV